MLSTTRPVHFSDYHLNNLTILVSPDTDLKLVPVVSPYPAIRELNKTGHWLISTTHEQPEYLEQKAKIKAFSSLLELKRFIYDQLSEKNTSVLIADSSEANAFFLRECLPIKKQYGNVVSVFLKRTGVPSGPVFHVNDNGELVAYTAVISGLPDRTKSALENLHPLQKKWYEIEASDIKTTKEEFCSPEQIRPVLQLAFEHIHINIVSEEERIKLLEIASPRILNSIHNLVTTNTFSRNFINRELTKYIEEQ